MDSGTGGDGSRSSADSVEGDVFKLSRGQEQLPAPERTAHATDGPLGPSVPSPRPPLATHADAPPLRVPAAPIAIPPIAATNMEHSCADDRTGGRAPQRIGLVAHRPMSAVLARTEADALANVLDDAPASPCDGNATDTTAWHATPPRQCTDSPRHTPPSTPCHPTAGTTPLLPSRREPSFDQLSELTDLIDDEPQCLDSFEEVATLGQGSFGRAVLMRSPSGLTLVAKQLRLDAKADLVRLDTEVVVLAKLRHRHICQYVHTAVRGEVLNIYIEYAAGGTLSDRIDAAQRASTPFEADVATAWIVQISMAVAYMHSMRVLHRDLSARNIFLSSADSIKVGDFGLSKADQSHRACSINGKTLCGTPNYFSPEMIKGEAYGTASDAWAVGLLAHEIFTLHHPFTSSSLAGLLDLILTCHYDDERLARAPYSTEAKSVASRDGLLHVDKDKRLRLETLLEMPTFREAR